MPLAPITEILAEAARAGAAAGAFNMHTPESAQGIVRAAAALGRPVILQVNEGTVRHYGARLAAAIALAAAAEAEIPVAVHLDHGAREETVLACLEAGFNSVMIDGSKLPLAENIALTRRVAAAAASRGAAVEAELGRIAGAEEDLRVAEAEAGLTDPDEAAAFVAATGAGSLAVAVGTAHGFYKGEPRLDYARLEAIRRRVSVPLVLHGASGLTDEQLKSLVKAGARKVNFSTELKLALAGAMRASFAAGPDEIDPRKLLAPVREAVAAVVRAKLEVLWP
ncbi:MAG: class II fructose-bisphosphate aldolase [Patescibacteria group bacterium]